jgi:dethiobiotin synthetase
VADLLVTGTDTGVGKTVIAAALVIALRERGVNAIGWKPVETGVSADEPADSELLAKASGVEEPLARPLLSLREPLAPALAAERAGVALDASAIGERLRRLRGAGYRVVVEGAGGLLAPLAWGFTALDLAAAEGLRAVVVARAGLGTLNHVQLTVEALARREVPIRGVVLNGRGESPDLAEQTNPAALLRLLPRLSVVTTPRLARGGSHAARALSSSLEGFF